jgi:hypothetical protein
MVLQNKLLYAALVDLANPGAQQCAVSVTRGGEHAAISGELNVAHAAFPLAGYAAYLALPPVCIAVFTIHQRLRRKSKPCEITSN